MYKLNPELQAMIDNGVTFNAKTFVGMRHIIAGPERYSIVDITIDKKKNSTKLFSNMRVLKLSENKLFCHYGVTKDALTITNAGITDSKNYTNSVDKFVQITIEKRAYNRIKAADFIFYIDVKDEGKIFIKDSKGYYCITNSCYVASIPDSAKKYCMLLSSAGDYKVNRGLYFRQDSEDESYISIIDRIMPGFAEKLKGKLDQKKAAKTAAYTGFIKTTGKMALYLDNFIIWNDGVINVLDGESSDGHNITRASFYCDKFNIESQAEACKIATQSRVGGSGQKFGDTQVLQDELFKLKLNNIFTDVTNNTVSTEVKNDVTYYYDKNGKLLLTVVGELDKATHIFDKNTDKLSLNYEYKENRGLTIMAVNHMSEGKLNSQIVESLMLRAIQLGREDELEEYFNNLLDDAIVDTLADIFGEELKSVSLDDEYGLSIIGSKCPRNPVVMNSKRSAAFNRLKNLISGLSFYPKFKDGTTAGFNFMVSCDTSSMFLSDQKVIKNAVFVAGIARKIQRAKDHWLDTDDMFGSDADITKNAEKEYLEIKERYSRVVITKAPKMGLQEYLNIKVLDFDELWESINALNCSNDLKRMLWFKYYNSPDGVVYFDSNSEVYKTIAGMDNDGDKVQAIFDKFIISLMNDESMLIIDTTSMKKAVKIRGNLAERITDAGFDLKFDKNGKNVGKTYTVDNTLPTKIFRLNAENQMSIGLITFHNNRVIAALYEALHDNFEYVKKILEENDIKEGVEDREIKIDDSVINEKFAHDLKKEMGKVVWSKENLVKFLMLVNKIFRLYQEGAIDATKTGIYLNIIFTCDALSIERLYDLEVVGTGSDMRIDRNNTHDDTITKTIYDDNGKKVGEREIKVIHLFDRIGLLEDKLAARVNIELNTIFDVNADLFSYCKEDAEHFQETITDARNMDASLVEGLYALKTVYNAIVSERSYISDTEDGITDAQRDNFKEELELLSNAVRYLIGTIQFGNDWTEAERDCYISELLLGIGCSWNCKVNPANSNRFAYTICPEYANSYFVGGKSYTAEGNIICNDAVSDGQTIMLSNGVSEDGVITDTRYTGEVVVTDCKVVANKTFKDKFVDENKAIIVYQGTARGVSRNSIITVEGEDIYFCKDVTANNAVDEIVGKTSTMKVFTGENNTEYYVDNMRQIYINRRVGNSFKDIPYVVAYLTK